MIRPRTIGAAIGLISASLAIAVAHLLAALIDESASPVTAVGAVVIDLSPSGLKEFAIRTFGTMDKLVLIVGIVVVLGAIATSIGVLAMRARWIAYAALVGFGAVGVVAAMTRPAAGTLAPIPTLGGVVAGLLSLRPLFNATQPASTRGEPDPGEGDPVTQAFDRRRFMITGAAFAGAAVASGIAGKFASGASRRTTLSRAQLTIPKASDVAPIAPRRADLGIRGLSTFVTPNDTFYRVDTSLIVPKIRAEDWRLRIHGLVEREIEMDMATLLERPLVERDITLACVSNEVGGHYIGNARWIGALLRPILEEAGVSDEADQLVSRSEDGFTIGTPVAAVMDGRDAMLAVAMNGEPLPLKHGFPVRMLVPGLYGYVSAMKWLVDLELTTFDDYDAYWVERGWARKAPIKTMSRIDTPRGGRLQSGSVPVAGVAWAQHKGIEKVEVRIDQDRWEVADLAAEDTIDTWRQWVYRWDAEPGDHTIAVRATDKTGYTQTDKLADPVPDGATGWHTVNVSVA